MSMKINTSHEQVKLKYGTLSSKGFYQVENIKSITLLKVLRMP